MIIAHTIPGKGVKEFGRDFHWHGKPPNKTQAKTALASFELSAAKSGASMSSLNPKVFDKDAEQVAIRTGFGEGFLLAEKEDPNVVGLCADLTESTKMNLFKEAFPERFIEVGVAEQNLPSVASGMAAMGKIPFISSYAMFSPGCNWK